jgi:hypothetical protein
MAPLAVDVDDEEPATEYVTGVTIDTLPEASRVSASALPATEYVVPEETGDEKRSPTVA